MSENLKVSTIKTIIGPDVVIKGEVRLPGPAQIAGRIEGSLHADDLLEITAEGHIQGDIVGTLVDIQGTVKGNVTATEACRLGPAAKLNGELRSANLAISEGATFVGRVFVGNESPTAPATSDAITEEVEEVVEGRLATSSNGHSTNMFAARSEQLSIDEEAAGDQPTIRVNSPAVQSAMQRPNKIIRAVR